MIPAPGTARAVLAAALLALALASPATAGLQVSTLPGPPSLSAQGVIDGNLQQDNSGNTSFGVSLDPPFKGTDEDNYPFQGTYYRRDRDLGQTFRTPAHVAWLEAVSLRIGPSATAVKPGAPGSAVSLQILRVSGTPTINDNGTTGSTQVIHWLTGSQAAKGDDYITGLTFTTVRHVRGGTLPASLAPGQWLRWELTGADRTRLEPNATYAFLVMFDEPGPDRYLALANRYFGGSSPGHGLRREGRLAQPWLHDHRDGNEVDDTPEQDPWRTRENALLPTDLQERLAQPPGTWGRPDVCTWRDLVFAIHTTATDPGDEDFSAWAVRHGLPWDLPQLDSPATGSASYLARFACHLTPAGPTPTLLPGGTSGLPRIDATAGALRVETAGRLHNVGVRLRLTHDLANWHEIDLVTAANGTTSTPFWTLERSTPAANTFHAQVTFPLPPANTAFASIEFTP